MKRNLLFFLVLSFVVLWIGSCGNKTAFEVGISMPTTSSQRWISDGNSMKDQFEEIGINATLEYAQDDITTQVSQVENMITKGVKILVIAAIDNQSLTDVLAKAHEQGISVIAYDRLILNSDYVDYYATFDNFGVGVLMGKGIVKGLDLENKTGPFNIELFGGSPDDNNSYFFFNGAMSILQPYIDRGTLVVQSGQTKFEQIATLRWDGTVAQTRMENLITSTYSSGKVLDAVLSPYDGISIGVISALRSNGYGLDSNDTPMPYVTGQDAEQPSIQAIIDGYQGSTVFKDTRVLAGVAVSMAKSILDGTEVEVNDTKTYDNNNKIVPSYLLTPIFVDKSNWKEAVIDSGYLSLNDFDLN